MSERDDDKRPQRLVGGLILMTVGLIFLLGKLDLLRADGLGTYWPMIVVAIGASKFLGAGGRRKPGDGSWLIFIGLWAQANVSHWFGLAWNNSWPLMLIYAGLCILLREVFSRRAEVRDGQ